MLRIISKQKKTIFLFLALTIQQVLFALNTIYITDKDIYKLNKDSYIYNDTTGKHTISTITSGLMKNHFVHNNKEFIRFDFSDATHWLRTDIYNPNRRFIDLVLSIENPSINKLQLFIVKKDQTEYRVETGDVWPFYTREFNNPNFLYTLNLKEMEHVTLYLKIQTGGDAHNIKYNLYSHKYLTEKNEQKNLVIGIFYGMIAFILLFLSITLIIFKNKHTAINTYFLLVVLFFGLWNANFDGITFQYFWPYSPWLSNYSKYSMPLIALLFLQFFVIKFLNIKKQSASHTFHRGIALFITTLLFIQMFDFIKMHHKYIASIITGLCSLGFMMFISLKEGYNKQTRFFLYIFFSLFVWITISVVLLFLGIVQLSAATLFLKIFLIIKIFLLLFSIITKIKEDTLLANRIETEDRTNQIGLHNQNISDTTEALNNLKQAHLENQLENEKLKNKITAFSALNEKIIQSILPNNLDFASYFFESTILFRPRESVGGDIYWIEKIKTKTIIACIDCSGHGAEGALHAISTYQFLNRIVFIEEKNKPDQILNRLQEIIHEKALYNQNGVTIKASIIVLDAKKNKIEYAAAQQPLVLIRNNSIKEIKTYNKRINQQNNVFKEHFEAYTLDIEKGDVLYLFTDGYYNQINESTLKKMKKNNFRDLLLKIHKLPLPKQYARLNATFDDWRKGYEQIDDILVIALRIL